MTLYDSGIRPIIDEHLKKLEAEKRDYGEYWSASSAGYCYRKLIFERLGIPPVVDDPRKQRVFSSGHVFHEWIQGITKDAGLSIAQELELQDDELKIRGHVDDLVLLDRAPSSQERTLILYDYKTAHSKWFEYAKSRPVSYYNKMQVGTYMYMTRNLRPMNEVKFVGGHLNMDRIREFSSRGNAWLSQLSEARILKISKDDLRLFEYQVLWTPELEKEVLDYWAGLNKAWKLFKHGGVQSFEYGELPPCTCHEHEKNSKTGIGFMADERYNPFFYEGEPCSGAWFELNKEVING